MNAKILDEQCEEPNCNNIAWEPWKCNDSCMTELTECSKNCGNDARKCFAPKLVMLLDCSESSVSKPKQVVNQDVQENSTPASNSVEEQ